MKNKTINHPFRTISFNYDETKKWTARDEKLLNLYIQMHDAQSNFQKLAISIKEEFAELRKQANLLQIELDLVKAKFAATGELADRFPEEVSRQGPEVAQAFVEAINATNDMIFSYDKKIRELREHFLKLKERENEYFEMEEDDTLWERLSELKITYFHDDNMAIDLVSLDDDEEAFRTKVGFAGSTNKNHMDYCERVTQHFNKLLLETGSQYDLWTEFGKRLVLLEKFTGPDPGFRDISLN